jgi:hypothetical protein
MATSFHVGVVEDRHDPLTMGRVRVRVFGLHSDDRINEVPIETLPWSMVMMPANVSTTASGVSQLVEGTWVLVMYHDVNLQDPIVIGSLPSTQSTSPPDYSKGFTDPFGVNPKWSDGTSNTSLAAKPDTYTEHPVYTERERTRVPSIPASKKYKASTVAPDGADAEYERESWAELPLRGGQVSKYPYNSVNEYEGGMLEEFDSSPGAQRVTRMHPSGTYDEIIVDGTRTIKIVGDGYELIMGNKNMYVKGNLNITVDGNMNQLVKGDYTLEVGGNYTETIAKSKQTKIIAGNMVTEVQQDVSTNIGGEYYIKSAGNHSLNVGGNKLELVANTSQTNVGGDNSLSIKGSNNISVSGNMGIVTKANRMDIVYGLYNIESVGFMTIDTSTNLDIKVGISATETVGVSKSVVVGVNLSEIIIGSRSEAVGVSKTVDIGGSLSELIGAASSTTALGIVSINGSIITLN